MNHQSMDEGMLDWPADLSPDHPAGNIFFDRLSDHQPPAGTSAYAILPYVTPAQKLYALGGPETHDAPRTKSS